MSSALLNDEIARRRAEDDLTQDDDQSNQSEDQPVTEPLVTEEPQQEDQSQQEQLPEERLPETPEQPQPEQPQPEAQVQPPKQQEAGDLTALQRYNDLGLDNFEPAKTEQPQVTEPSEAAPPQIDTSDLKQYQLNDEFAQRVEQWKQAVKDKLGLDINITEGYRDPARSDELKAQGIIAAPGGYSYHNYGQAIDYGFRNKDGSTDLYNEKAYTAAEKLAHQFGLTGISIESGHIQNADYPTINDLRRNQKVPQITGKPGYIAPKEEPKTLAEYNDAGLDNFDQPQTAATYDEQGNIKIQPVTNEAQRAKPAGLQDNGFYQNEDPKDFVSGGVHTFGGAQDQANYLRAKQAGATEAEALAVGDNGVGAPRLGSIDTSSAIGLAIPLDAVKAALGDKPTNWRTARVDVVGPNGVRLRLPIVDFGPRDTANTAADLTENAAKLFKTTDGKFSFKIVPNVGPDIEKDPDAYKKEQILLSQGIDPGSQGTEHATFPTTTGPTLTADQLALRDKALAQDQQDQKDAISKLPEFTSGSIPGLIKRLEGDEPIPGVSDGMRQAYADSLKQSATAYAQSYYGIKDPDEAYKKIMSDADVGTVLGDLAKKSFAKLGALGNSIGAQQQIVDENRLSDFFNIIGPNATPERKAAVLNYLKGLDPEQRRLIVAKMYHDPTVDPGAISGINLDDLQTGLDRISDPKYQAARTQAIADDKAQTQKLLESDPRLKGTTMDAAIDRLSEIPKLGLEIGSGWIGRSMIASDIYAGALESAKQDHPDWTEEQQRNRATASTFMQLLPAEALTMLAGQQLPGISGAISKIENPVQRLLASTLTHTGIGGGAMTLQSLGRNIAEGKPLDTGLVESFLTGAVLGAPGGVMGGLRAPEEAVPRGTEVTPPVEAPKLETPQVEAPKVEQPAPLTGETEEYAPPAPVTKEDVQRRAYEISEERQANGTPGDALSDWVQAQEELAKNPSTTTTAGESEPWVSSIANRYTAQRVASGELGEIAPGQGYSTEDLIALGMQMPPSEIDRHVSDVTNNIGGNPKDQAAAVRVQEAYLSQQAQAASRTARDNPTAANKAAENAAFNTVTAFHNDTVAKLKNNWHAMGMSMQGEVPLDLSNLNGMREAYLRDTGKAPPPELDPVLEKQAKQVSDAVAAEKASMSQLSAKIDDVTSKMGKLPTEDEVMNKIIDRMKVEPCST